MNMCLSSLIKFCYIIIIFIHVYIYMNNSAFFYKYKKYKIKYNILKKNTTQFKGGNIGNIGNIDNIDNKTHVKALNMDQNPILFNKFNFNECIIYYINLESSYDRRKHMESQTARENLAITRFDATNAKNIDISLYDEFLVNKNKSIYGTDMKQYFKDNPTKIGHFGCYLSFLGVMKKFLKTNKEYLIIFEDDAIICNNFTEQLVNRVKLVPDDWDIILIGYKTSPETSYYLHTHMNDNIIINNGYMPLFVFNGMHGMLYTRSCVNKLLKLLVPMDWMIDFHISSLAIQNYIKIYGLVHPLIQIPGEWSIKTNLFEYTYHNTCTPNICNTTTNI
jgi:GR25 family glycosyltransferase involved in LPS biosynthesis